MLAIRVHLMSSRVIAVNLVARDGVRGLESVLAVFNKTPRLKLHTSMNIALQGVRDSVIHLHAAIFKTQSLGVRLREALLDVNSRIKFGCTSSRY